MKNLLHNCLPKVVKIALNPLGGTHDFIIKVPKLYIKLSRRFVIEEG
jgi:hypothetical protein